MEIGEVSMYKNTSIGAYSKRKQEIKLLCDGEILQQIFEWLFARLN